MNLKNITLTVILAFTSLIAFSQNTIYSYKVKDIDGKEFDFASLKGKKILIVNTASKCGFTPQYEDLQKLYEKYKNDNFVIIGFPANNFKEQEPGTDKEIAQFCTLEYGVTFPMMSKVSVKGEDMAPIYQFLTKKELNGYEDSSVRWNFQKYLINEDGTLYDYYSPWRNPDVGGIIDWIEGK